MTDGLLACEHVHLYRRLTRVDIPSASPKAVLGVGRRFRFGLPAKA
jgi:hypothetical protein